MADISEAMVEALQAAHNLIANTAFDAGESHQWAIAVDEKIQAALALSAAPASAQMEGWQRLKDEARDYRLALTKIVQRADPEKLSPIIYEAAQQAARIASDALAKHGIKQVDWPNGIAFPAALLPTSEGLFQCLSIKSARFSPTVATSVARY